MIAAIPAPPPALVEYANPTHRQATPATLQAVLAAARCGDEVDLLSGAYPATVKVSGLKPSCPVVIDASVATLTNLLFSASSNWIVERGNFAPYVYASINITSSDHISVRNSRFMTPGTAAISITTSTNIEAMGNQITGSGSDGIDIAASQFVVVDGNACMANVVVNAMHPDCVQAWSIVGDKIASDLWITNNVAAGPTQGFSGFDHGWGGFARVYVKGNVAATNSVWAAGWNACQSCIMTGNVAYTLLGQPHGWGGARWIMTDGAALTTPDSGKSLITGNTDGIAP